MRTSFLDILRLAWALYRVPHLRRNLRIGQLFENVSTGSPTLYYIENNRLVARLNEYARDR